MTLDKAGSGSVEDRDFNALVDAVRSAVKTVTVPVAYTDIDLATGLADLYLLPENETLLAVVPIICTEAFNGQDSPASGFSGVQCFGPTGAVGDKAVSDSFDATGTNDSQDGLIAAAPVDTTLILASFPGYSPVPGGGPVQLTVDFTGGNTPPLTSVGTTGQMTVTLVLLVRS